MKRYNNISDTKICADTFNLSGWKAITSYTGGDYQERLFRILTFLLSISPIVISIVLGIELFHGARLAFEKFGLNFFVDNEWNPVQEHFGALPFIFGTVVTSFIALVIATPIGIGSALFLSEFAPSWIKRPIGTMIELLAAIPSVILGLWGILVMVPFLRFYIFPVLKSSLGFIPLFNGPIYGPSILAAGILLSVMIVPIITAVARDIFMAVPQLQKEAAVALGATKWEATKIAVLGPNKIAIFGAVVLGLSRALGETMAVTMVIGNRPEIAISLFAPAHTMASALANEFAEATTDIYLSALFALGVALIVVTLITNCIARLIVMRVKVTNIK